MAHQRQIVAKIEELFSELDAGEEILRKARRQLGVYRQSLLKQAFEGKLTAAWREQNPQFLESTEQLFASVQSERKARYQKQLKDWEANRSKGKRTSKPAKPVILTQFDQTELTDRTVLPEGWLVVAYGDLSSVVRNGISQKPTGDSGYKIARISAVRPMFFDYGDYRYISCDEDMAEDFALKSGDLVFTRYNGARRYVGVCAHFTGKESRLYPDKLIRTRPDLPSLDASFLELALNSGLSRAWLETKIRTTAGQSGVSGGDIKAMPVAFCSLAEQQEIVRLLDEQFTVIEQNEREIDTALKRSEALRQSILKKAFSGQLVVQDPADEPAGVLLERIRAEREAAKEPPRKIARVPKIQAAPEEEDSVSSPVIAVRFAKKKTISTPGKTDLQAGLIALAMAAHENSREHLGHVKAEKIVHLCDVIARLELDRRPVKDAAGPNDLPQAKRVEHRAKMQGWFTVEKKPRAYIYHRGRNFSKLLAVTETRLGSQLQTVRDLIGDLAAMSMQDAELVATVHAAWNNLILAGESQPTEAAIVKEAREDWHEDKLKIPRKRFFDAIAWIERAEVIPAGTGALVGCKPPRRPHHA